MNEIGIDISSFTSKSIDELNDDFKNNLDYVITLCSEEICPYLNGNFNKFNWANEDPADYKLNAIESAILFQKTRDNIYNLLKRFMLDNL